MTDKRTMARQKPEFGRRSSISHQPLAKPDDPNLGTPIMICAAPVRVCAGHFRVSMSCRWNTSISAYLLGDLARRLIPWTAALLAGGFETSRSEALLRPPDLHSAGRTLRGNP